MKSVVILDSMSNIPSHVLENRQNIKAIPLNIEIGGTASLDLIDTAELDRFYRRNPLKADAKADATSPTPDQMTVFLLNEVIPYYDCAIFQSTSAALSDVYQSISECAETIEAEAQVIRKMAGNTTPFKLICFNSGNSSSGQTLIALYTNALLKRGVDPETAVENAKQFKETVKTYSVVSDLMQARTRMKMVGHKTISMTSAVSGQLQRNAPLVCISNDDFEIIRLKTSYKNSIKSLFEFAEKTIAAGLHLPIVHLSYAGNIKQLYAMKEFKSLQGVAKKHGVALIAGMMSVSACINYSTGSFSLGIAPKDSESKPA